MREEKWKGRKGVDKGGGRAVRPQLGLLGRFELTGEVGRRVRVQKNKRDDEMTTS